MSIFATRLKELRGAESQASFASSIGVNRVQYAKYESGQNLPSIEILERICAAHDGVSADWLLGLRDYGSSANARASARTASTPGEMPVCSKCPHLKKLKKLETLLKKI